MPQYECFGGPRDGEWFALKPGESRVPIYLFGALPRVIGREPSEQDSVPERVPYAVGYYDLHMRADGRTVLRYSQPGGSR